MSICNNAGQWRVFLILNALYRPIREEYRNNIGLLAFDKDDKLALDFVAASNLRSTSLAYRCNRPYVKQTLVLVHAIATTNAIIAGLKH